MALQVSSENYRRGLAEQRIEDGDAALLATVGVRMPPLDQAAAVDFLKTHHPAEDCDELDRLALLVDAGAVALLTTALAGELPGAAELADWYLIRAALFAHRAAVSSAHAAALVDVIGDWRRAAQRHRDSAISSFNQQHGLEETGR